jgi:dihydroflavonol-4-reductase
MRELAPVLVTGAGGFVGGHVARELGRAGYIVRGLTRRSPRVEPGDPPIEWLIGDLRLSADRRKALAGIRSVVHAASWVSLASDPRGEAAAVNVEATRALLADCVSAGVERLVYTSTLHTLAAGTAAAPADEGTPWNLDCVTSPYALSKREAERVVLDGRGGRLKTLALCPGMVLGPRDPRPTSTRILLALARRRLAIVPGGGIPVVDAHVIALAHRRALERGEPGRRYAVVGRYLSYPDLARLVAKVAGRPWKVLALPDSWDRPLAWLAGRLDRLARGRLIDISAATVAGGFLQLHVRGDRANHAFGLIHPPPIVSIYEALDDARRSGRASRLRLRKPEIEAAGASDQPQSD